MGERRRAAFFPPGEPACADSPVATVGARHFELEEHLVTLGNGDQTPRQRTDLAQPMDGHRETMRLLFEWALDNPTGIPTGPHPRSGEALNFVIRVLGTVGDETTAEKLPPRLLHGRPKGPAGLAGRRRWFTLVGYGRIETSEGGGRSDRVVGPGGYRRCWWRGCGRAERPRRFGAVGGGGQAGPADLQPGSPFERVPLPVRRRRRAGARRLCGRAPGRAGRAAGPVRGVADRRRRRGARPPRVGPGSAFERVPLPVRRRHPDRSGRVCRRAAVRPDRPGRGDRPGRPGGPPHRVHPRRLRRRVVCGRQRARPTRAG